MFRAALSAKLKRIFDVDKVTFDLPGESKEQEGVFVAVSESINWIKQGREIAKVTGKIHVFAPSGTLPFGYFYKMIQAASIADTKDLIFLKEENLGTVVDICEKSLGFVYLYDSQYDPDHGEITEVNFTQAES